MDNKEFFTKTYDKFLKLTEERIQEQNREDQPEILYEPIRYFMKAGGKRIRPVLTMMACGAAGGNPEDALDSAVAVEMLHNFTLVHDDIMDKSDFRRGRPTVHKKWNEATAILVGDVMVGHCLKLLPSPEESKRSYSIQQAFTKGLIEVCEGQALDMLFGETQNVNLQDYLIMIRKKTSQMLETAAVIGGNCGEGSETEIEALRNYAENLGLAFQIQDDLLDLTANEAALGKKVGKDIVEGKKTYLIILANERAKEEKDKELLKKFYRNNGLPYEEVDSIRELMERTGVVEQTRMKAQSYFEKAKSYLDILPDNDYSAALRELADSLNDRKK